MEQAEMSPILVTGGTGTLGQLVIPLLQDAGCDIRVLSRRVHEVTDGIEFVQGDLAKNEGIDAAVKGTQIVIHCAGSAKGDEDKTRHLVQAAQRIGIHLLVYISCSCLNRLKVI